MSLFKFPRLAVNWQDQPEMFRRYWDQAMTALESRASGDSTGVPPSDDNMGTSPGDILSDNGTAKEWFVELEAAVEDTQGDTSAIQTDLDQAEADILTLQTGLGEAEADIITLQSGLNSAEGDIIDLRNDLDPLLSPLVVHAKSFGVVASSPASPTYIDTELETLLTYVRSNSIGAVVFEPGLHFCQDPHTFPRNVEYVGEGAMGNWRVGSVSSSFTNDFEGVTTFVACGTGAKTHELPWITAGTQAGYDRDIPVADRVNDVAPFQRFELFDGTNKDGTSTTAATPKAFSALISFDEGWGRIIMNNIRVVASCPSVGEVEGLGGYTTNSVVYEWADWDFGIFVTNPWHLHFRDVQGVGYWKYGSHLSYGHLEDHTVSIGGTPHGECGLYEDCFFQSGVTVRAPDMFPVRAVTGTTASIRWTPSLCFSLSGGTFYASSSDSISGLSQYTYTSATYDNTDPLNPLLQFNGVAKVGGGAFTIVVDAAIIPVFAAGHTGTEFKNCIFSDFAHNSSLDDSCAELNDVGLPGRPGYRAALEISGSPMRSVRFNNCFFSPVGPIAIHMGSAYDILFTGDCYAEGKLWKSTLGGSFESARGAVFVAGARAAMASETGSKGRTTYRVQGEFLNSGINMVPLKLPRAGARMETMTDVHNVTGAVSDVVFYPNNLDLHTERQTYPGKWLIDTLINSTGVGWLASRVREVGGTPLVELANAKWQVSETYIRPSADDTLTVGQASRRINDLRASNITPDKVTIGNGGPAITKNAGTPEGVLTFNRGTLCIDTTNGKLYIKTTTSGNTGWVVAGTQT